MSRILELDFTRGIAVNLMILSHIGVFLFITLKNMPTSNSNNFLLTGKSSVKLFHTIGVFAHTLFLILVGVNMVNSYKNTKNKSLSTKEKEPNIELDASHLKRKVNIEYAKKNSKRAIFIGLIGLLMSILTRLIFGKWYIIFGIFQFITVAIFLSIPIQIFYNHLIVIGIILVLLGLNCINFPKQNSVNLMSIITGKLSNISTNKFLDFFPIIPYFIMVLIGIIVGNLNFTNKFSEKMKNNKLIKEISNMGRWSVQLYFLHIVIIYGIMKIVLGKKNIKI
jgi:uncharacterized membrane protein